MFCKFACMFSLLAGSLAVYVDTPEQIGVCQLRSDPAAYNHKLIQVTAFVSRGFEDFTLFDPTCEDSPPVWLEYGGTVSSQTVYCCGSTTQPKRSRPIEIEGIRTVLIKDERFQAFDRLVRQAPDRVVRATLIGRFFSGYEQKAGGSVMRGYGHMGCCSLFAIQQVVSVAPQDRTDLDYRAASDPPEKVGCGLTFLSNGLKSDILAAQKEADRGAIEWAFEDARQVAVTALAKYLATDPTSIRGMREIQSAQGRIVFEWKPSRRSKRYTIVTSRPYWLSFYARDPMKVAWAVISAYEACE